MRSKITNNPFLRRQLSLATGYFILCSGHTALPVVTTAAEGTGGLLPTAGSGLSNGATESFRPPPWTTCMPRCGGVSILTLLPRRAGGCVLGARVCAFSSIALCVCERERGEEGGSSPPPCFCPRTPTGSCRPRGASADLRRDHPLPTRCRFGWTSGTCEGERESTASRGRES